MDHDDPKHRLISSDTSTAVTASPSQQVGSRKHTVSPTVRDDMPLHWVEHWAGRQGFSSSSELESERQDVHQPQSNRSPL